MSTFKQHNSSPELDTLSREAEALTQILKALEEEHSALINSQAERLEAAIAKKNTALENYAAAKTARESTGLTESIHDAITNHPNLSTEQRTTGIELASAIRITGENCKRLNQRNGMLISSLRDHTQRALNLVRNNDEPNVLLYSQQGDTNTDNGGCRTLGTA